MFSKQYLILAGLLASSAPAFAHVSITNPVQAGKSAKVTLGVGHGCNNSTEDTWKVRVDLPADLQFTNTRALTSDFGRPTLIRDGANKVIAIEWVKPDADKRAADDSYYELTFRLAVPNTPFRKYAFPVTQTCVDATGNPTTPVHWDGTDPAEPAPSFAITPGRLSAIGWNKITIPANTTVATADLAAYFGDALIVWKGTAAFSNNPNTTEQINATTGVTALGDLAAGDVIWVRY